KCSLRVRIVVLSTIKYYKNMKILHHYTSCSSSLRGTKLLRLKFPRSCYKVAGNRMPLRCAIPTRQGDSRMVTATHSTGLSQALRLTPRPYQYEAVAALLAATARGGHRPLLVFPTGTGKTIVFALLVQRRGGRSLILAHRDELIQQAVDKLRLV